MKSVERYEKLPLTHIPVNKTAALVTGKGWPDCDYRPTILIKNHFDVQPPTWKSEFDGIKFGHFTVIGKYLQKSHCAGSTGEKRRRVASYLVKCVCGKYETRTAKTIKAKKDPNDKCVACRKIDRLSHYLKLKSNQSDVNLK